jgi:hypothetical protein
MAIRPPTSKGSPQHAELYPVRVVETPKTVEIIREKPPGAGRNRQGHGSVRVRVRVRSGQVSSISCACDRPRPSS